MGGMIPRPSNSHSKGAKKGFFSDYDGLDIETASVEGRMNEQPLGHAMQPPFIHLFIACYIAPAHLTPGQ